MDPAAAGVEGNPMALPMVRGCALLSLFMGVLLIAAVGRSVAQDVPDIKLLVDGKLQKTWLHDEIYAHFVRGPKGSKEKNTIENVLLSSLLTREATGVPAEEIAMVRVIAVDGALARQRLTAKGDGVAALMKAHLQWQNHKTGKSWKLIVNPELARAIREAAGEGGRGNWIHMPTITRIEVTTRAAAAKAGKAGEKTQ
jgi:hypothetical protein